MPGVRDKNTSYMKNKETTQKYANQDLKLKESRKLGPIGTEKVQPF